MCVCGGSPLPVAVCTSCYCRGLGCTDPPGPPMPYPGVSVRGSCAPSPGPQNLRCSPRPPQVCRPAAPQPALLWGAILTVLSQPWPAPLPEGPLCREDRDGGPPSCQGPSVSTFMDQSSGQCYPEPVEGQPLRHTPGDMCGDGPAQPVRPGLAPPGAPWPVLHLPDL